MAIVRMGGAIQSKIAMLLWGEQGTGKSTMALQSVYLKRPDGKPFRVMYIDAEAGSIDDYAEELFENGVERQNLMIVYSQSLEEIRGYIKKATNNEPFYELDENGEETDEVILDADDQIFNPDMIVVDGTAILYMTSQQGLINFSKKRAAVRAKKKELLGDERLVSVELAGMEQKDWGTLKFKGQDLVLDLTACGKHYVITAREKSETETKEIKNRDGSTTSVSVATGRKIPDSFGGVGYNVKTEIRMYRERDDYETVKASVIKDRTGVHTPGEVVEDPSLLDWQAIIDRTAKHRNHAVKNSLVEASQLEEQLYSKSLEAFAEEQTEGKKDNGESLQDKVNQYTERAKALKEPKKSEFKKKLKELGIPSIFRTITDMETFDEIEKLIVQYE